MSEGLNIPLVFCAPFAVILLLIAIMPLAFPRFWEKNLNKSMVAAVVSIPVLIFMIAKSPRSLGSAVEDYISFIILLASLFIISGGILVKGDLKATPVVNTVFLLVGAIAANLIGTTGASMLLIRPLLSTIRERKHIIHIPVFFIFIVSNIGGSLTPLGDPPLFMGYLRGVPFTWTFRLFPIWLFAVIVLSIVFFIWDSIAYKKEDLNSLKEDIQNKTPLMITGKINLLFLLGVIAAVFCQVPAPYRELIMVLMIVMSLVFTKKELRVENNFTYGPIIEVAILFAGIFITMVPLLMLLETKGAALGIVKPWQFFWFSGGLSSFLDNTPTYVTFASLASSVTQSLGHGGFPIVDGIGVREDLLLAISAGSVFMGANTYIGNGPNFMVKSIAEEQGVEVPHFFGYMLYSICVLIPLFGVITLLFFR